MNSLLIGYGQVFSLVKEAFLRSNSKFKIIGQKIPAHLTFKNKKGEICTLRGLLRGKKLTEDDFSKIDAVFVSIYNHGDLGKMLGKISKLKLSQPVFVKSSAITEHFKDKFSDFYFVPIQKMFERQVENFITQSEYLFRVKKLASLLKPKEKVLITIFENPDPDAIASAMALKTLLKTLKVQTTIAYTGEVNRVQNKALIDALGTKFYKYSEIDTKKFSRFATVDAQPFFFKGKKKFDIVIDHHPKRVRYNASFIDVRPKMGATSTMMTGYLANSKIRINKKLATALLYGIKIDTNNLEQHVTDGDVRAFRYLFSKADHDLLKRIELSEIPQVALPYFEYGLKNKRIYKDRIYVNLGKVDTPEVHVMVADFLLRVNRISTVIISAIQDHNLVIIFRNDGYKEDVGKLASLAFGKIGHAGGHKNMARAEVPCSQMRKVCKRYNKKAIDSYIFRQINKYIKET